MSSCFTPAEKAAVMQLCQRWSGCPLCGIRNISVGKTLFCLIACEVTAEGEVKMKPEEACPVMTVTCKGCLFSFFIPYSGIQELVTRGPGVHVPGRPKLFGG